MLSVHFYTALALRMFTLLHRDSGVSGGEGRESSERHQPRHGGDQQQPGLLHLHPGQNDPPAVGESAGQLPSVQPETEEQSLHQLRHLQQVAAVLRDPGEPGDQVESGEVPDQHPEEKPEKVENAPVKRGILRRRKLKFEQ